MSNPRVPRPDRPLLLAPLTLLLIPLTAHADGASEALGALAPSSASLLLRALGSLGGVVALIALLALLLRKLRDSPRRAPGGKAMRAVGRLDLGGRREIRLVEIGARRLVLGVTERRIDLLTELDPDASATEPASEESPAETPVNVPGVAPAVRVLRKLVTSS